ncbi:MAG: mannonate dehydratase [Armatimonadetes bacterium]|nr:mannonate dehydratase [Armatimonadota bacterium]
MRVALYLSPQPDERWKLAAQMGVTDMVTGLPFGQSAGDAPWGLQSLQGVKQQAEEAGLNVSVIESSPPMEKIRLGLPGRDEEIDYFCDMLRNMGELSIPVVCYNFMAVLNWLRTSVDTPTRGGALVTSYDHATKEQESLTDAGLVSEERLWENFQYFIQRVVPVAEKAKVYLALHPDDPPISPVRGVGRIFRNPEAFERAMDLAPSMFNSLTFCQGCFATMGVDIPDTLHRLGKRTRIPFAHFRDIRGTVTRFEETFHDDGQTDMLAAMRAYKAIGFDGPMRPDHVPTMEGDANDTPGYTMRGRLFAVGYMKGLMEAAKAMP